MSEHFGKPIASVSDLNFRRTFQGALVITSPRTWQARQYMGYTKREAIALYRAEFPKRKRNR